MICKPCAAGADAATVPELPPIEVHENAVSMHGACRGDTWCDCRHRVAPVEVIAARRAALAPING